LCEAASGPLGQRCLTLFTQQNRDSFIRTATAMYDHWIAQRIQSIEVSGIRKVFDLARSLKDPVDLSIGVPDFDVAEPVKAAAIKAINRGQNAYTLTQGIPELRTAIHAEVRRRYPRGDRETFVTSGTSGGLVLALLTTINPGDEVIIFDPYFVLYAQFIPIVGGKVVVIDTYPDFRIDIAKVEAALTPRTKAIIVNNPANPTGVVYDSQTLHALAQLAHERRVLLISDEVYSAFCYDSPFASPAEVNDDVLVLDGFSKAHAMTGWRLGYCHGPRPLIEQMIKLQQLTFVCAPTFSQHAGIAALAVDQSAVLAEYKRKRDRIYNGLKDRFEIVKPGGAFYIFPKAPRGTGQEFVAEAIRNNLLCIPGMVFSRRDTHFRLSFAASDKTLDRGVEILNRLAAP
jgi:aspartate aminotransferase/aminotransferase